MYKGIGMGLGIGTIETLAQRVAKYARLEGKSSILFTKPHLAPLDLPALKLEALDKDVVQFSKTGHSVPTRKLLSQSEIANMKPSEYADILKQRTDIDEALKTAINSPDNLNLYDSVINLRQIQDLPEAERKAFLETLFIKEANCCSTAEVTARTEVLPRLIEKGYSPTLLADLPITHYNKNQIEYILSREDLVERLAEAQMKRTGVTTFDEQFRQSYRGYAWRDVVKHVDDSNVKYLDECVRLTANPRNLHFWNDETAKIVTEFIPADKDNHITDNILDRIFRRGHDYQSVKAIVGDKPLDKFTSRLLEFKNHAKFKDIGTAEFGSLTTQEKKEFLNGFISSIDPKEIQYNRELPEMLGELQSKMKIFKEISSQSKEAGVESYYAVVRNMLHQIPEQERQVIRNPISWGNFRADYRALNPIPPLVDDLSMALPTQKVVINGRKIKVAQMAKATDLGIATHRFPKDETILNIEALEITDPNMILCIGLKDGKRQLNFNGSPALAVKSRLHNDWWLQARSDIDSGNGATKNIFNIDRVVQRSAGNHVTQSNSYVQELLKKELNLSQVEYTRRVSALKDATTLDEVRRIDPELEQGIRKVVKENSMYEGIIRPEVMGVCVSAQKPLMEVGQDVLDYCVRRNVPLIQVLEAPVEKTAPRHIPAWAIAI